MEIDIMIEHSKSLGKFNRYFLGLIIFPLSFLVYSENGKFIKNGCGLIYATETKKGLEHKLRVFNPTNEEWKSLPNCPLIDPRWWDVGGDICVYSKMSERDLFISRLPNFTVINKIPRASFADPQIHCLQEFADLKLSPDNKYLAILFRVDDALARKNNKSYYSLGGKCKLIIIDPISGKEIIRAPRWASNDGFCWLPDSRQVIFASYNDESMYDMTDSAENPTLCFGNGFTKENRSKRSLYKFDMNSGKVVLFGNGYEPSLASIKKQILVQSDKGLLLLDKNGKTIKEFNIREYKKSLISPDGYYILAELPPYSPFKGTGKHTLISTDDTNNRIVIDEGLCYKYEWVMPDKD